MHMAIGMMIKFYLIINKTLCYLVVDPFTIYDGIFGWLIQRDDLLREFIGSGLYVKAKLRKRYDIVILRLF